MIVETAERSNLASEIDDGDDSLINQKPFATLSTGYGISVPNIYGGALWAGLRYRGLHAIGSTEKYKIALHNF